MTSRARQERHAYLVMAHDEPRILELLLSMLDDPRNDIYLHIDRRAGQLRDLFTKHRTRHAGLHILDDTESVYWGDISQVKAELKLFKAAHANGPYLYYHLLSGTDLPVKTQDHIHEFFSLHRGKEFVEYHFSAANDRDIERKVRYHWFFTTHLRGKRKRFYLSALRKAAYWMQRAAGTRRGPADVSFHKGHNWVSITHRLCGYILDHETEILDRYRHTICADEIFIQTLLWHSPYRDDIYRLPGGATNCLRAIDWERGTPYAWQESDYDFLLSTTACFARKITTPNIALAERLHATLAPSGPDGRLTRG